MPLLWYTIAAALVMLVGPLPSLSLPAAAHVSLRTMRNADSNSTAATMATSLEPEAGPLTVYISTHGSDHDCHGTTLDCPFRTPEHLLSIWSKVTRNKGAYGVRAIFRAGTYHVPTPLELNSTHSGDPGSPIQFTNYKHERVILSGGTELSPDGFMTVTPLDEPRLSVPVLATNISEIYTPSTRKSGASPSCDNTELPSLFQGDSLLLPAGYPNAPNGNLNSPDAWTRIVAAAPGELVLPNDVPVRNWENETNAFCHLLTQENRYVYARVKEFDGEKQLVTLEDPEIIPMVGGRCRFLGLYSELDVGGEFLFDYGTGMLLVLPPRAIQPGDPDAALVLGTADHVLETSGWENGVVSGLEIRNARGTGVMVEDGNNVVFNNCTIAAHGGGGILLHGTQNAVSNSIVNATSCYGIALYGGVPSVKPGGNTVSGTTVSFSGQRFVHSPGVIITGVANNVHGCNFHDLPGSAIRATLEGASKCQITNSQFMETVAQAVNDAGYIQIEPTSGQAFTMSGNQIFGNAFHHPQQAAASGIAPNAIRLADFASGCNITGNTFFEFPVAVYLQGGHFIHVTQCKFHASLKATAVYLDDKFGQHHQGKCGLSSKNYQNAKAMGITVEDPCSPSENSFRHSCVCKPVERSNIKCWPCLHSDMEGIACHDKQGPCG